MKCNWRRSGGGSGPYRTHARGDGNGYGYGYSLGYGYGRGYGYGTPLGNGLGDGNGFSNGDGYGYGDGNGNGAGTNITLPVRTTGTFDGQMINQLIRPQAGYKLYNNVCAIAHSRRKQDD